MLTKNLPITRDTKILRNLTIDTTANFSKRFVSRMNSYLGFMRHYDSYAVRRRVTRELDKEWWQYCYIQGHHEKAVLKVCFRKKETMINKLKNIGLW